MVHVIYWRKKKEEQQQHTHTIVTKSNVISQFSKTSQHSSLNTDQLEIYTVLSIQEINNLCATYEHARFDMIDLLLCTYPYIHSNLCIKNGF